MEQENGRRARSRHFQGTVWVEGDPDSRIPAELAVSADRLAITSGSTAIGDWPLHELDIRRGGGYLRIDVEGERLMIDLTDPERFARAARVAPEVESRALPEPQPSTHLSELAALRPSANAGRRRKPKPRGRHLR